MRYLIVLPIVLGLFACNNIKSEGGASEGGKASSIGSLRKGLAEYISTKKADIGVAVLGLEDGDTLSINGHKDYSLMSVAKFPQALLLLHLVDEGKIQMKDPLHFDSEDLKQRTGSTLRKDHPQPSFDMMIPEALKYAIGQSDNITAIKIFKIEGGPGAVNKYVHGLGIREMSIVTDYAHLGEDSLHHNWASPVAVALLLKKFYMEHVLSDSSRALLWKVMVEGPSGANRIKGGVPAGTIVGHKTGTASTDSTGITPAFNDAGIVQLPNGKHFAVVVFVANSKESEAENAAIIAHVSKEVWDYYQRIKK